MTALAEKLKEAGADTIGAQLTTACIEGLRRHPNNARAAWDHAFNVVGRQFLIGLMADMDPKPSPTDQLIRESQSKPLPTNPLYKVAFGGRGSGMTVADPNPPKPYTPRVIPQERLEKRRELQKIIRSKYKNSAGVSWSEVSWHELVALGRDGKEAAALLAACSGDVPNDGRTVGEVLGIKKVDEIIAAVRELA
jgi:hypothetical protein